MRPKYKWLQARNVWTGKKIKGSWAEEIPSGWYKAFGEQMIDELNNLLTKYCIEDNYQIVQIKEKYGSLRWYDNGIPQYLHDEYHKWLNKYETLSTKTCISCGKPATHMTKGYVIPLCDECK